MTSTRLPGKILKDVGGRPMLAQQIRRLKECRLVDEIVLATTTNKADDRVAELSVSEKVGCFRGSEHDVLSRFVEAAKEFSADVIVRATGDCPLIDPQVVDDVISDLVENGGKCDYTSNVQTRTFPRGLDVEAFFIDTLRRIDRLAISESAREHVTLVARSEKPRLFLCRRVLDTENNSDLRLTVDTEADLQLIRHLYEDMNLSMRIASYREIVAYLRARPQIIAINQGIETWNPI